LLSLAAITAFCLVILTVLGHGHLAMSALLAVGICNSIMFPSIFTLGIQGLGPLTSKGSSFDDRSYCWRSRYSARHRKASRPHWPAFLLPALCYVYIAGLGLLAARRKVQTDNLIPVEPV
jgi:FHS family L-fucose permease-like MFS transporter